MTWTREETLREQERLSKPENWPEKKAIQDKIVHEMEVTAQQQLVIDRINRITQSGVSLSALIENPPPDMMWIVHNIVPERGITMLVSPPKSYKTYFAMDAALAVATGEKFLNKYETIPKKILYIDMENGTKTFHRRIQQLAHKYDLEESQELIYLCMPDLRLNEENAIWILTDIVEEFGADLVILDSMVRLMRGSEDKAEDVRDVFSTLRAVMEELGCSFLVLHHTRKGNGNRRQKGMDEVRGSSDFAAMVDVIVSTDSTDKGTVNLYTIANRHLDLRYAEPAQIAVRHAEGDQDKIYFEWCGFPDQQRSREDNCRVDLLSWLKDNQMRMFSTADAMSFLSVEENGNHSKQAYYGAINSLLKDEAIIQKRRGYYEVKPGSVGYPEEVPTV